MSVPAPEPQDAVRSAVGSTEDRALRRRRKAHEALPMATLGTLAVAVGAAAILWSRVPTLPLCAWLFFRILISVGRYLHALHYVKHGAPEARHMLAFRVGVFLDALGWSFLGWGLTPLDNLEVAVVSISVELSVVALGGAMLYTDMVSARIFLMTVLLPNGLYALTRGDDLGIFCCVAFFFATFMFLDDAKRTLRRVEELQRLRDQAKATVEAQAQALEEARSLNAMKSRFTATMSHEMRTPIHGILGLLRMARPRVQDATALRHLDLINSSGEHLLGVVNGILEYSKMEEGALPIHDQPFDLHAVLTEVVQMGGISCHDKGLRMESRWVGIEPGLCVHGDPLRLRQVLFNLIGNAVKFTQEGSITLHAHRDEQRGVTFSVQDTGIGIAPEEIPKIFRAYHQAEGTYKGRYGGTGLGLTISRELCAAMGGALVCRSVPGQGSIFEFTLPLPRAHLLVTEAAPSAAEPSEGPRGPEVAAPWRAEGSSRVRVLLVDDNPVNAIIAEAELQRLGIEVIVRYSGADALTWMEQGYADLVLMDCDMPDMDGAEATRRLRAMECSQQRQPVPVVALTAHAPEVDALQRAEAGMDGYLSKPFTPAQLLATLEAHLPPGPGARQVVHTPSARASGQSAGVEGRDASAWMTCLAR